MVDTLGNLIQILVHAANLPDTKGGSEALQAAAVKHATIKPFSCDEGYRGTAVEFVEKTRSLLL